MKNKKQIRKYLIKSTKTKTKNKLANLHHHINFSLKNKQNCKSFIMFNEAVDCGH